MKQIDISNLTSPKRQHLTVTGRSSWYPYYAGFSPAFATEMLQACPLKGDRIAMDPWNGSGTTTSAATRLGFDSYGFDLNPVMAVVARARLLSYRLRESLSPLAATIIDSSTCIDRLDATDPLLSWFTPRAVRAFRQIEQGIQRVLMSESTNTTIASKIANARFSDLVAFFYLALFRAVRSFSSKFQCSNPTWTKLAKNARSRLSPGMEQVAEAFRNAVCQMVDSMDPEPSRSQGKVDIRVSNSLQLPIEDQSVNIVVTSPPYCTRIDYAAATRLELAVLGIGTGNLFDELRREMIGTPTVPPIGPVWTPEWGQRSRDFLDSVKSHSSRASSSYYHKGYCQYFQSLCLSFREIHRCLRSAGYACIVVQDSYYKEIHVDLASFCIDMAEELGLQQVGRKDFPLTRSLGMVNSRSRHYRNKPDATESVLVFLKN